MPRPWIHRLAAVASVALLAASVAGCQSSVDPTASPERLSRGDAGVELASHGVETKTRIHRVFGRLPDRRRKAVRSEVGAVVDGWWEAAYLGGTYPRSSFPAAFPGFTRGAEARARADKALLTNETQGPSIDSVTAKHRSVVVDVLATGGQARSVTAHVVLRFETTGDKAGTTTVRGRLFLTRRSGEWKVFGYDVSKGAKR
ncbi:hypothetical protein KDN32_13620 [Nocardioides sp. J2M5]|uniref:hypothetical protein n=1 Tax=Nocardioides palaemonis TaxID=2829810 RepID=UPI001BA9FBD0|nr:hypothetical protein [Nocardioides palaemonis]MBS2938775.1 hypothetical protein [Nocardioides palaemonis]